MIEFGRFTVSGEHEGAIGDMPIVLLPHELGQAYPWWSDDTRAMLDAFPFTLSGLRVCDFGSGASAILGVAMWQLGAAHVTCVERYAELREVAERTLALNGVEGEVVAATEGGFDFIAANVGDDELVEGLQRAAPHGIGTGQGGRLIRW